MQKELTGRIIKLLGSYSISRPEKVAVCTKGVPTNGKQKRQKIPKMLLKQQQQNLMTKWLWRE